MDPLKLHTGLQWQRCLQNRGDAMSTCVTAFDSAGRPGGAQGGCELLERHASMGNDPERQGSLQPVIIMDATGGVGEWRGKRCGFRPLPAVAFTLTFMFSIDARGTWSGESNGLAPYAWWL